MEGDGEPRNTEPYAHAVVNNHTVEEETFEATVQEVEEPLLSRVRAVMPDVATSVGALLVEVFLTVPSAVLHFGDTKTLAVCQTHILHVTVFVVS